MQHPRVIRSTSVPFSVIVPAAIVAALVGARVVADPIGRYAQYAEVHTVLAALPAAALPPALQALPGRSPDVRWDAWVVSHDADIRARLARGDEDTLVNWLLFGTSFTSQPRVVLLDHAVAHPDATTVAQIATSIDHRLEDFLAALQSPGDDERRLFARRFFEGNGFSVASNAGTHELGGHLVAAIRRIAAEQETLGDALTAARQSRDLEAAVNIRSHLYSGRGLSLDTSLAPNFALERSLAAIKARGLLKPGTVARVGIIGAGLDFTDKNAGFDFYPVQTVQPFAIVDALWRLGLAATAAAPDVVCFDISPRVLAHLASARERAATGSPYLLHLALPKGRVFQPEFRDYWARVGLSVGTAAPEPIDRRTAEQADLRTLRVDPSVVQHVSGADLNIVTQRIDGGGFDLLVATNVLLYYSALDQAVALANAAAMLRPGGFLLTNTPLPEVPGLPIALVDSTSVRYDTTGAGDDVFWYRRLRGRSDVDNRPHTPR